MRTMVPVLAGLLLVVGACGDDDGSAGGAEGTIAEDTVATSATTTLAPGTVSGDGTLAPGTTGVVDEAPDESPAHGEDANHEDGVAEDAGHEDESDGVGDAMPGARAIEVSMTDFEFEPATVSVTAGETVTFRVSNDGEIVHEFRLSNTHRIEEHLAEGHADHGDDGHHGDADVVLELGAGESGELTVTFPEDTTFFTEIACLIPGHYEAGMKGVVDHG